MIKAATLNDVKRIVSKKYDYGERRIVGLMLARYELSVTRNLINECYNYWNENSGEYFDVFWCGYGKYAGPSEQGIVILDFPENKANAFFSNKEFITAKRTLNRYAKEPYSDQVRLVLVEYFEGNIHLDKSMYIDLEKNSGENEVGIRAVMEWITEECIENHDIGTLQHRMKTHEFWQKVKGISFWDAVNTTIGAVGLLK